MRKRYPTDVTDAQWELMCPLLPPAKPGGRPRTVDLREVVNTLFYQARTNCPWDYLPHDLVAKSTAWDYFENWQADGTWLKLVDALRTGIRLAANRDATPSAACIDTQTVKTSEMGGPAGYDGGKKIKGRKRHIVVDSMGLLLAVAVTTANLDDGTSAPEVLQKLTPEMTVIYGDNKYNNRTLDKWLARTQPSYHIEVKMKPADSTGFVPIRIRWVVERTHVWLSRCRRLNKDHEYTFASSETWVYISAIQQMLRRASPDQENRQAKFKYPKKNKEVA